MQLVLDPHGIFGGGKEDLKCTRFYGHIGGPYGVREGLEHEGFSHGAPLQDMNCKPDTKELLAYTLRRVHEFVLQLGDLLSIPRGFMQNSSMPPRGTLVNPACTSPLAWSPP